MLYFITGNAKKFAEAKAIIPEIQQLAIDLPEIQELNPQAILEAKLEAARSQHPEGSFLVEDTSLELDGLNGLPGPLIKWFLERLGSSGIQELVVGKSSTATARTVIGYASEKGELEFFEGATTGQIVPPNTTESFGWDPIFLPDGSDKRYSEMTLEEKNATSHRGKAFKSLSQHLTPKSDKSI